MRPPLHERAASSRHAGRSVQGQCFNRSARAKWSAPARATECWSRQRLRHHTKRVARMVLTESVAATLLDCQTRVSWRRRRLTYLIVRVLLTKVRFNVVIEFLKKSFDLCRG